MSAVFPHIICLFRVSRDFAAVVPLLTLMLLVLCVHACVCFSSFHPKHHSKVINVSSNCTVVRVSLSRALIIVVLDVVPPERDFNTSTSFSFSLTRRPGGSGFPCLVSQSLCLFWGIFASLMRDPGGSDPTPSNDHVLHPYSGHEPGASAAQPEYGLVVVVVVVVDGVCE